VDCPDIIESFSFEAPRSVVDPSPTTHASGAVAPGVQCDATLFPLVWMLPTGRAGGKFVREVPQYALAACAMYNVCRMSIRVNHLSRMGLVFVLAAGACLNSPDRGELELELLGAIYPRARCAKGPAALGRLYPLGEPVAGGTGVLGPDDVALATNAEGIATLKQIPAGSHALKLSAPAFVPSDTSVTIKPGATTRLRIQISPCVYGGGHQRRVGFDKPVTLTATTLCGDRWNKADYTWTQVEGPDIRGTVTDWNRQQLTFVTRKLEDVRSLPDDPKILSFSPDQAGEYVFQVTARNQDGLVAKDYVLVTSANTTGGMNSIPPYETYYFVGTKQGPWNWRISRWPTGWPTTLEGENTRTPSVHVLPSGPLTVQETLSITNDSTGITFSLVVGDWGSVPRDCGRSGCHPPLQRSWEGTRHASTWHRLIDGQLPSARAPGAESCATCHSLGYDRSVTNGGYDDIAKLNGVTFPDELKPGNYAALPVRVKEVSNVHCVACHGPARVDPPVAEQPGRFEVGVCARCHDRLPEQDLVAQWRTSLMSRTIKGDLNGPEARSECARCHTAQGFYYNNFALGRPPNPNVISFICCENLAPITCQTCHSPMYARNKAQLFAYDGVRTTSGLDLKQVGSGAICIHCHNTEHDVTQPRPLLDRLAPHSPQADVSYGRGGFRLGPDSFPFPAQPTCSRDAGDGCATCHMDEGAAHGDPSYRKVGDHTFHMVSSEGVSNTRPCQVCHDGRESFDPRARHDYDGNAKVQSVRQEVDGLMVLLQSRLSAAIVGRGYAGCDPGATAGVFVKRGFAQKIVVTDAQGFDLGDCDRNGVVERKEQPFLFPDTDLLLHKAAYNYLLVQSDKSRGLHNLPFVVSLLQRTIHAVTGGKNLPDWDLFQPR